MLPLPVGIRFWDTLAQVRFQEDCAASIRFCMGVLGSKGPTLSLPMPMWWDRAPGPYATYDQSHMLGLGFGGSVPPPSTRIRPCATLCDLTQVRKHRAGTRSGPLARQFPFGSGHCSVSGASWWWPSGKRQENFRRKWLGFEASTAMRH